ncbi:DUF1302 domain-containing protein [Pseudomonas silensiensis]|uniref:DUF1302 domain-containing protein n=1 Tax=Pseudomonas silensiensis TaxID=2991049 RepID=UPI003D247D0F
MKISSRVLGKLARVPMSAAFVTLALPNISCFAGETINFDNGASMDYTLTANYGIGVRAEKQSRRILNQLNADDSDRNFDRGSLTTNRLSLLIESDLHKDNYGLFLRGSTFYDAVYKGSTDNKSQSTLNHDGDADEFSSETRKWDGSRTVMLDAYTYGAWDLGGESKLSAKLGKHLVAWGENVFFPGISGGQNGADASKSNIPGVETKDVLLGAEALSSQWNITQDWSLVGYSQFRFRPTELSPTGDYLFSTDVIGPGSEKLFFAPGVAIPRTSTDDARDSGQWGIGTRYRVTPSTELGLYHINYHAKTPSVVFDPSGSSYHVKYFEDIKATAMSISTRLGDYSLGGEVGYYQGLPVQVNTAGLPQQVRGDAVQAQANIYGSFGPNFMSDQVIVLAEVIGQKLLDLDSNPYGASTKNTSLASSTRTGWGYSFAYINRYLGVFDGWDMTVPIAWNQGVKGSGVIQSSGLLNEGDKRLSVGSSLIYLDNLEIGVKYNMFFGDVNDPSQLADRDFVTLNAKYSF